MARVGMVMAMATEGERGDTECHQRNGRIIITIVTETTNIIMNITTTIITNASVSRTRTQWAISRTQGLQSISSISRQRPCAIPIP